MSHINETESKLEFYISLEERQLQLQGDRKLYELKNFTSQNCSNGLLFNATPLSDRMMGQAKIRQTVDLNHSVPSVS